MMPKFNSQCSEKNLEQYVASVIKHSRRGVTLSTNQVIPHFHISYLKIIKNLTGSKLEFWPIIFFLRNSYNHYWIWPADSPIHPGYKYIY